MKPTLPDRSRDSRRLALSRKVELRHHRQQFPPPTGTPCFRGFPAGFGIDFRRLFPRKQYDAADFCASG